MRSFCLRCYRDSIRSYFTRLCFKNLFLRLSLSLYVVARSVVNTQHSIGCSVVCFPGMTSSLAKSKQIIGCALSDAFFVKFSYFLMFLDIQIDLIILKADDDQFTLTTKSHCISLTREFGYFQQIRVLSSGTMTQTLDLANFSAFSRRYVDRHNLLSIVNLAGPSEVYYTERPPLFAGVARFLCASRDLPCCCAECIYFHALICMAGKCRRRSRNALKCDV